MIEKAILKINPNAKFIVINDDVNNIQWTENTTPIPVADIQAQIPTVEQEIADEIQAKADLKLSAKTKLMNGEALTEDEANVMVGL